MPYEKSSRSLHHEQHRSITLLKYCRLEEEESLNADDEYQSLDGRSVLGASVAQTGWNIKTPLASQFASSMAQYALRFNHPISVTVTL